MNLTKLGKEGEYKTLGSFTFFRVFDAGHMVPTE